MRFFTFLITACAVIISTNAENTAKRDSESVISNDACSTLLEETIKTVSESAAMLGAQNFDTADDETAEFVILNIDNENVKISLSFKDVSSTCCESLKPGSTHVKTSLDSIGTLVGTYTELLSNLKSKKALIEKNPKIMDKVKILFQERNPEFSNLINCVRNYPDLGIQLTAKNLVKSFSTAWNDFKNYYGI